MPAHDATMRQPTTSVEGHPIRPLNRFGCCFEDALPNSLCAPAVEAIVARLGWPTIDPSTSGLEHMHDAAQDAPIVFGFTPRRLLGISGSILTHCASLNQNKFARMCWPAKQDVRRRRSKIRPISLRHQAAAEDAGRGGR
jgi:hypothetical protein